MSLVVVAYPNISQQHRDWIECIRARHDELYHGVIDAHFTLVFPVSNIASVDLTEHVRRRCLDVCQIQFALRCAMCVKDAFSDFMHVFLVPDAGFSSVMRLHDRLYTGPLEHELRLDIPFIPHIGVGNSRDAAKAKRVADHLNVEPFSVDGTIDALDVASYADNRVTTIERISLKPAS
jgi:hypothetical protein